MHFPVGVISRSPRRVILRDSDSDPLNIAHGRVGFEQSSNLEYCALSQALQKCELFNPKFEFIIRKLQKVFMFLR